MADDDALPPVSAIKVGTGIGKTRTAASIIAEAVKARGKGRPYLYAVPTHRLGEEIVAQFRERHIAARVFRGRNAADPDRPGQTMCDDLEAVSAAIELGLPVSSSCCRTKDEIGQTVSCLFYLTCSYQRQKDDPPDVWIVAHQMLFHAQAALGKIESVFIDESFWQAGLWSSRRGLTLEEIEAPLPFGDRADDTLINDLESARATFARALRRQKQVGEVERRALVAEGMSADLCTTAIALEWRLKDVVRMWPGMPPAARKAAAEAARGARHTRALVNAWNAARDLLHHDDPAAVSGRLILADVNDEDGRRRVIRTRGVRSIAKQWQEPTIIMDATLPALEILRAFYPEVTVLEDAEAEMPHVRLRQVLGAPVSSRKLGIARAAGPVAKVEPPEGNRNLRMIRRAILHRFLDVRRGATLVVAQKAVAEWLKASGIPAGISVEWFNNVAGLDRYKDVRLLIVVGRTMPTVFDVEDLAGALTGLEPERTPTPEKGPRWYRRVARAIRLADGAGYEIEADTHPDPVAEACRHQICEAELIQAIGRARGVRRTPETPLDVDILADVVLPLTVDAVVPWAGVPAGAEVEMAAEGVILTSPTDMARCWPKVWATAASARQWQNRTTSVQTPIEGILYRASDACAPVRY